MRHFISLIAIFVSNYTFAKGPSKVEIRLLYKQAATDEESCKNLVTLLKDYTEKSNTLFAGYKACATMMMANYVLNPFTKLSHFSEGKNLLEKAITADKANIELRFLRFSVQSKAPSFLGYNTSIKQDKILLINDLGTLKDLQLKQLIIAFLKNSEYLTYNEKQKIK